MAEEKEKPLTREDVIKAIEENGRTAKGLDLSGRKFEKGIDLSGLNLERIILKKAILIGARLERANLMYADFERAKLSSAHLEEADLSFANFGGAILGAAHLEGAALVETNLEGTFLYLANLARAYLSHPILSFNTNIQHVNWGNYILGEEINGQFRWAEDTYRQLKTWYTEHGMNDIAAKFYYREMEARRKETAWSLNPKLGLHRLALEALRALFGYGERWRRVLISIAVLILLFSLIYCVIGSVWEWSAFGNSLYFSAVSFTALGYGSWVQVTNGWIKGIGAFESLVGVSMLALLLVTFFRKWTR